MAKKDNQWKSIHHKAWIFPVRSRSEGDEIHLVYFGKPFEGNSVTHEDMTKLFGSESYFSCTCSHFFYHAHEGHCYHITFAGSSTGEPGERNLWEGDEPEFRDGKAYVPGTSIPAYNDRDHIVDIAWTDLMPIIFIHAKATGISANETSQETQVPVSNAPQTQESETSSSSDVPTDNRFASFKQRYEKNREASQTHTESSGNKFARFKKR